MCVNEKWNLGQQWLKLACNNILYFELLICTAGFFIFARQQDLKQSGFEPQHHSVTAEHSTAASLLLTGQEQFSGHEMQLPDKFKSQQISAQKLNTAGNVIILIQLCQVEAGNSSLFSLIRKAFSFVGQLHFPVDLSRELEYPCLDLNCRVHLFLLLSILLNWQQLLKTFTLLHESMLPTQIIQTAIGTLNGSRRQGTF